VVARIGYHAPHEQHPPRTLLAYVQQAEEAGFETAMCSDHLGSALVESGFDEILLHNVHRDQESFICDFAEPVLPALER